MATREQCRTVVPGSWSTDQYPIQLGLGKCPWRVAIASMLLCRARRAQIEHPLHTVLTMWPDANALARAEFKQLESVLRPTGFQTQRTRQMTRFSSLYTSDGWHELTELPGVGVYVNDAVNLFCFNLKPLGTDEVLRSYYEKAVTRSTPVLHENGESSGFDRAHNCGPVR